METLEFLKVAGILLFSVVIHEYAHGFVAYHRGDPTAKMLGRLTLNPIKHIDPLGTILVPLLLKLNGAPVIGWAKPVPVVFQNLHDPRRDMILVAAAGPAVNLVFAFILSLLLKMVTIDWLAQTLVLAIVINLALAVFNLMPVPPLDGSRIVMGLLPPQAAKAYAQLEPIGLIIVIVLLNFGVMKYIWMVVTVLAALLGVRIF